MAVAVQSGTIDTEAILADEALLRQVIKDELLAIKEEFATPRLCQITLDSGEMSIEDLVDAARRVIGDEREDP